MFSLASANVLFVQDVLELRSNIYRKALHNLPPRKEKHIHGKMNDIINKKSGSLFTTEKKST